MAQLSDAELLKQLLQGTQTAQASDTPPQPPIQPVAAMPSSGPGIAQLATPSGTLPRMGPSPQEIALRRQIEEQMSKDIATRGQEVALDKQAVQQQAGKSGFLKADLSPLMQMAAIAGGNPDTLNMYKAPVDNTDKLRAALENSQKGLSTSQSDFLKNQLDKTQANSARQDLMQQRLNERVYGGVITGIQKDPTLHDLVEKSNNITRIADVAFSPNVDKNTTSLNDLQQTVTGALSGLKGTGGVSERSERYMSDMATDLAKLKQRFGETQTIPSTEPILVHYMQLAHDGQKFLQEQAEKRLVSLAGGHENITNQPGYDQMLRAEMERIRANVIQPKFMNTGISNAALTKPAGDAFAKPQTSSMKDFIKEHIAQARAQKQAEQEAAANAGR